VFVRIVGADGKPMFLEWFIDRQGSLPAGAVEVDRMPGSFEDWTTERGWHVTDEQAKADFEAGPAVIAENRLQKRIEASQVKFGVGGSLVAEAEARGIDLNAMADMVLAKAGDFVAAEVAR